MLSTLILLFSATAFSAGKPVLSVEVQKHHAHQWTKVFHGKDGWYCSTDRNPLFPLREKPKFLALLKSGKVEARGCHDTFKAVNEKGATWEGCSTEPEAREFLHALGDECGRF